MFGARFDFCEVPDFFPLSNGEQHKHVLVVDPCKFTQNNRLVIDVARSLWLMGLFLTDNWWLLQGAAISGMGLKTSSRCQPPKLATIRTSTM
jgi:hypothetical protein